MKILCHVQLIFECLFRKKFVAYFEGGQITFDAGFFSYVKSTNVMELQRVLLGVLHDPRWPDRILHDNRSMLQQRLYSITLGYEDNNNAAFLRKDPARENCCGKTSGIILKPCLTTNSVPP